MKETGIIMTGNHPKLILDGIKTMTRRVIKPQPILIDNIYPPEASKPFWSWLRGNYWNKTFSQDDWLDGESPKRMNLYCPYGQVGDRLWVRETFANRVDGIDQILYKSDYISIVKMLDLDEFAERWHLPMPNIKWKPSIHMFRKDSRITLEITDIRVERLQEITQEDAKAEAPPFPWDVPENIRNYRYAFLELWDSLNAKRGYGWEVNPWVWVISFGMAR